MSRRRMPVADLLCGAGGSGTKTDKIKQIGNAVSVAMMQAEVAAIMADAAPAALPQLRVVAE